MYLGIFKFYCLTEKYVGYNKNMLSTTRLILQLMINKAGWKVTSVSEIFL